MGPSHLIWMTRGVASSSTTILLLSPRPYAASETLFVKMLIQYGGIFVTWKCEGVLDRGRRLGRRIWQSRRVSELRVLPDQLSGFTQCCNGFFFVGSRIKSDGYNLFQTIAIVGHQVISMRRHAIGRQSRRESELRVLPDQLSGPTQCCNGFFFVGSVGHQVISMRRRAIGYLARSEATTAMPFGRNCSSKAMLPARA